MEIALPGIRLAKAKGARLARPLQGWTIPCMDFSVTAEDKDNMCTNCRHLGRSAGKYGDRNFRLIVNESTPNLDAVLAQVAHHT